MFKEVYLVANGDLRLAANQTCEAAQQEMEKSLRAALAKFGVKTIRAHKFDPVKKHSFIDSQKMGMQVFRGIPPKAPLIVAESVWQYSHHLLPGLITHKGPILTVANWSGTWPGLVGLLNLNASLTKAGVAYSTLWSESFDDTFFLTGLKKWLTTGKLTPIKSHVKRFKPADAPLKARKVGEQVATDLLANKSIMGVFDEGCMGMYNAIVPDELMNPLGIYKERLSQSALYAAMQEVSDDEAEQIFDWLTHKGMKFDFGTDEATQLTKDQVLKQCKMYIAATRIADEFGCDTIGIQYQQGLKDLAPASDLVEGLLNNVERPTVFAKQLDPMGRKVELYAGEALPHFNEVDECAGIDALITYRLWRKLGFEPETTLHDLRWARQFTGEVNGKKIDDYVWVLEISGAAPPAHFIGGFAGASSERQPPMYFRLGGGTLKGVSKPGHIVWSRVFIENDELNCDIGTARVIELPTEETEDRLQLTTPQWPIMHTVLNGVTRDQMMSRHKSNHIQVAYAPDARAAKVGALAKAVAVNKLGVKTFICGKL
jgi:hypothetical protein